MTSQEGVASPGALLLDTENLFYKAEIADCTEWLAAILWWSGERIAWVRDRRSYGQPWDHAVMKLEPLLRHHGFERIKVPGEPDAADHALVADLRHLEAEQPVVVGSGDAALVLTSAHALVEEGRVIHAIMGPSATNPRFLARFSGGGDLADFRSAEPLRKVYREFLRAQRRSDTTADPPMAPLLQSGDGVEVAGPVALDLTQLPWGEMSPAVTKVVIGSDAWDEKVTAALVQHGVEQSWATEFVEQLKPALDRCRNKYLRNELTVRPGKWRQWVLAASLLAGMWPTAAPSSPAAQVLAQADAVMMQRGDLDLSRAMELARQRLRRSFPLEGDVAWRFGR